MNLRSHMLASIQIYNQFNSIITFDFVYFCIQFFVLQFRLFFTLTFMVDPLSIYISGAPIISVDGSGFYELEEVIQAAKKSVYIYLKKKTREKKSHKIPFK